MKATRCVLIMAVLATGAGKLSAATDVWTSLGPEGGEIERLVVDPQNPSTLYAVAGGAVFKTVNAGLTWNVAISAAASGGVRSLVIHPQDSNTLYAVGGPRGLKSRDGGFSWSSLNLPDSLPLNSYVLAVDARLGALYARTCSGIARSMDEGESWVEIEFSRPLYCSAPLAVDPTTSVLYTTHSWSPDGLSATDRTGGILKSEDGGETWSLLELGVKTVGVYGLAIDPQNSTIYAVAGGSLTGEPHFRTWLFRSNDGGVSWVVSTGLNDGHGVVAVDPKNPNTVYFATRGAALRSMDGGTSWKAFALGEDVRWFWSPNSVTALAIASSDSSDSSAVYAGTYARGVWKSADDGETWTAMNSGLTAANIQALLPDPQNTGTLYGVMGGVEIVKTADGGVTWKSANSGLPTEAFIGPLAIDPQNPARLYAATGWEGVFTTTDGGTNWASSNIGLPGAVNGVTIDPQNGNILYAGIGDEGCWEWGRCSRSGVFKSTDGGASWSYSGLWGYWVARVAVAPSDSNVIYAVGFLPRLAGGASDAWYWGSPAFFKSTNGGATWDVLSLPIPSMGGLAINPQQPSTAYIHGDLLKTNDGGTSWSEVDLRSVQALAIDPQTPSTIYAGTTAGVFRSIDGGESWTAVNSGLTTLAIATLAFDPQDPRTLFAGTSGGGVFRITFDSQAP